MACPCSRLSPDGTIPGPASNEASPRSTDRFVPLQRLNPEQSDAVATRSGPLLVLAGAGTGKTRVVTIRIAELIRQGIPANRILAVTFTNKAAAEMQDRVGEQIGRQSKTKPVIGTFHSYCVQILRRQIARLGYPEKFTIYDRGQQESVARTVLREIKVSGSTLRPGDILSIIGRWKNSSLRPEEASAAAETDREHLAAMAYRRYQKALKQLGAVDFDDLLLCVEELFRRFPDVRREEAKRFDHVLVDEYQDTNATQYRIVRALAAGHHNLCVVGDDDQSIYGWRGAEVEHILRFRHDWPNAKVIRLEQNYRSTGAILEMANQLIEFNQHRLGKVLRAVRGKGERPQIEQYQNETEEARQVVADIGRRVASGEWTYGDFAILFRTNQQPRSFETELRRVKMPYVLIGGPSFYDRREIRDVLAYLKLIESPTDEVALRRIINTPPRGIGSKGADALLRRAEQAGKPLWDILEGAASSGDFSSAVSKGIRSLLDLVAHHQEGRNGAKLVPMIQDLLRSVGYEAFLRQEYPENNEAEQRWEAVEELVNAAGVYVRGTNKPTLGDFLDDVALGGRETSSDKERQLKRDAVLLMTMHSAKGLEFPHVYMVGMEEGLLPHHRSVKEGGNAIDEERRLCYVGITRAMERLTLSLSLARMKWGKPRPTTPSRFLFEITGQAEKSPGGAARTPRPHSPEAQPASNTAPRKTARRKRSTRKEESS